MMRKTIDVIGIANPILDLVLEMDQLPPTNTNGKMNEYCFQGGGNVTTALAACGMLGLKCAVLGIIGDDMAGRANIADFKFNHVDISHLIVDSGKRTNFCVCITERRIGGKEFISKGGECRPLAFSDLDEPFIKSARMLHIGGFTPEIIQSCEWIHESGGKVSIDAAYYRPDIYENYRHIDLFIGSETYFNAMPGKPTVEEAVRSIQKQGPEVVIFTFGGEGCCGVCADNYFRAPAFKVDVVDTTGAGDVFHGAYDYAYLQGWEVEKCVRFASATSAIKCTRPGGRSGIPRLAVLNRFLEDGFIDYTEIDERVRRYKRGFLF